MYWDWTNCCAIQFDVPYPGYRIKVFHLDPFVEQEVEWFEFDGTSAPSTEMARLGVDPYPVRRVKAMNVWIEFEDIGGVDRDAKEFGKMLAKLGKVAEKYGYEIGNYNFSSGYAVIEGLIVEEPVDADTSKPMPPAESIGPGKADKYWFEVLDKIIPDVEE